MNVSKTIKKAFIKADSAIGSNVGQFEVLKPLSYCFKETIGSSWKPRISRQASSEQQMPRVGLK